MKENLEAKRKTQVRAVLSFILILGILGATALIVTVLVINKRTAKVVEGERLVPAVEVLSVSLQEHAVELKTQGVVESKRETGLAAEVAGRVMEISSNLKRGGRVSKDELLVRIDPSDYRAALATAEVALANAELALEQEKARVEQAELDWDRLGRGEASPLALRQPQLVSAKASVASANEEVARASRNLERTEIRAPFDAAVRSAPVEVGAVVAAGRTVAELYTSEELEVRLPLGLGDFGFLKKDDSGSVTGKVVVSGKIGGDEFEWQAETVRLDPEIERKTLSATVIVKVLAADRNEFPLPPVGLFVNAQLSGELLEDVAKIPRRALVDMEQVIVVGEDEAIEFREIEVARLTETEAIISAGLEEGDRVVLTRLSAPVVGMKVAAEEFKPADEE